MIFNSLDYYLFFLFPAAELFKLASPRLRPWVLSLSAAFFYIYFSLNGFGGIAGALCLSIFL
jgi:alginate O-acetyltransferase complex protein AlgI